MKINQQKIEIIKRLIELNKQLDKLTRYYQECKVDINDLTINEVIELLKQKIDVANTKKIKELERKLEKEKKSYLKMLRYFKNRLEKVENKK